MSSKFGLKQMNNPTPHSIANLFDFLAGTMGIVNAWMLTASYIPHGFSDIAGSILSGLIIPLLLYFKRWFGKEVSSAPIEIDKVMEVKDPPDK